jgi:hypothetical protein
MVTRAPIIGLIAVVVFGAGCHRERRITSGDEERIWAAALASVPDPQAPLIVVAITIDLTPQLKNIAWSVDANSTRIAASLKINQQRLRAAVAEMVRASATSARIPDKAIGAANVLPLVDNIDSELRMGALANCRRCTWVHLLEAHADRRAIVWMSRAALVGEYAVMYLEFGCGDNCGHGTLLILHDSAGQWEIMEKISVWIS